MSYLRPATATLLCAALINPMPATAAEPVGQAIHIKTEVTGQSGPLVVNSAVHRDERIRTSQSGLGQFVFRDGTKLAVGWGSSVVIDKYIFDDSQSVKRLSIRAAKGTFRWISGSSKSSAYQILTPAGTIGVRGTAFDFYVGPNGTTAVVMLNGAAQLCGPGGCRQLTRRCDCVIATPGGNMTDVRPVNQAVLQTLGTSRALPFLSGIQALSGMMGAGCGLTAALRPRNDTRQRQAPATPAPDPAPQPEKPAPQPQKPAPQPQKPTPQPEKPTQPPEKPAPQPEKPHPGGKPRDHGKPHDRPHKSHDRNRDHHNKDRDKADHSRDRDDKSRDHRDKGGDKADHSRDRDDKSRDHHDKGRDRADHSRDKDGDRNRGGSDRR